MIDRTRIRRTSLLGGILCLLGAGAAAALGSFSMAGGIVLGSLVGATTFLSWAWFVQAKRWKPIAVVLLLGKLGAYAALFYLLVTRGIFDPIGVFLGLTAIMGLYTMSTFSDFSSAQEGSQ